jgi:hypothetical protein
MNWEYGYDYSLDYHQIPFDGKIDYLNVCKNIAETPYNNVVLLELNRNSDSGIYLQLSDKEYLEKAFSSASKINQTILDLRNKGV